MLKKIFRHLSKIKNYTRFFRKNRKIKQYKDSLSKQKKKAKRNKYSIQLKIDFKIEKLKRILFVLFILFIVIIGVIIKWPFLKIKEINIIRLDENINIRLIEKRLDELKWQFLFSVKPNYIEDIIKETQQNIKSVSISKIPPHKITIRLSSYDTIFSTNVVWKEYLISQNWVFLPNRLKISKFPKIEIKGLELQNYPNYKKILKSDDLYKLVYLRENLEKNIANLKIQKSIYYKVFKEIHFVINNKTRLIFDLEWNLDEKLKQIFVFNRERINITKGWIIYIDNRVNWKIYYCDKEELPNCIENINYIYDEDIKSSDYR